MSDKPDQPRQPQNLQGLMKFAMEATKAEDAPGNSEMGPLDPERRAFLEKTLHSLTIDVVEMLQKAVSVLKNHERSSGDDKDECINALDTVLEYVDNLDTANDFYKIGGFAILPICLASKFPEIRALGCELIAELTQNNPFCQQKLLDESTVFETVLQLLTDEESVAIKAMYAVSCIVRSYEPAISHLLSCGGLNDIIRAIGVQESASGKSDKLRAKGSFLLRALCVGNDNIRNELVNLNVVEQISSVLMISHESYEHLLSALLSIISVDDISEKLAQKKTLTFDKIGQEAVTRARKPELQLRKTLENTIKEKRNLPEYQEVVLYSTHLLSAVFPSGDESTDR